MPINKHKTTFNTKNIFIYFLNNNILIKKICYNCPKNKDTTQMDTTNKEDSRLRKSIDTWIRKHHIHAIKNQDERPLKSFKSCASYI